MKPIDFFEQLKNHDWDYAQSDDHSKWQAGSDSWKSILRNASEVEYGFKILSLYQEILNLIRYGRPQ